jgi:hypothetical protein
MTIGNLKIIKMNLLEMDQSQVREDVTNLYVAQKIKKLVNMLLLKWRERLD